MIENFDEIPTEELKRRLIESVRKNHEAYLANPNRKEIEMLRKRLRDIYASRIPGGNICDSIPSLKAEIKHLEGNPHVERRIG